MSANLRDYEDYLNYMPKEEGEALKEAREVEGEEVENVALCVIRQMNRSKETLKRVE